MSKAAAAAERFAAQAHWAFSHRTVWSGSKPNQMWDHGQSAHNLNTKKCSFRILVFSYLLSSRQSGMSLLLPFFSGTVTFFILTKHAKRHWSARKVNSANQILQETDLSRLITRPTCYRYRAICVENKNWCSNQEKVKENSRFSDLENTSSEKNV